MNNSVGGKGFKILRVKHDADSNDEYHLFIKRYEPENETLDRPKDRTLVVCNIPAYVPDYSLELLFEQCAPVNCVLFAPLKDPDGVLSKPTSKYFAEPEITELKVAYVVFNTPKGMKKVLSWSPPEPIPLSTDKYRIPVGLDKYLSNYFDSVRTIPPEALEEANEIVQKCREQAKERVQMEKKASEPNEEGWITVTRSGKNPGFSRKRAGYIETNEKKLKKKKKKKELVNFYTFQKREAKLQQLTKLKEQFERDKKKLERIHKRKFYPVK